MRTRLLVVAAVAASAVTVAATAAFAVTDGPDVASYQHPSGAAINWGAVHSSGRTFAIVKATEGTNYTNPYFAGDWAGIRNAGMYRGAYHFARPALPLSTAADQARYYVSRVGTTFTPTELPPILDLEVSGGLSPSSLSSWALTFLNTVSSLTHKKPMLYTYPHFFQTALASNPVFHGYSLWIADYNGRSAPTTTLGWQIWTFWQYTSSATVSGIPGGSIDMSRYNGSSSLLSWYTSTWSNTGQGTPATTLTAAFSPRWTFWGNSSSVVGRLVRTANGASLSGRRVVLYTKAHTSPTWTQRAVLTTASDGTVRTSLRMSVNTDAYLAFYPSGGYAGARSPKVTGTATPRITIRQNTSSIRLGQYSTISGAVAPVLAGQRIYRQELKSGRWVSVASTTISSAGTYSFPVHGSIRGSYSFRVLTAATASYDLAYSPTVGLRVS